MRYKTYPFGIRDQGKTCNASGRLIGIRHSAVNNNDFTTTLNRIFAILYFNRRMTAYNACGFRVHTEIFKNRIKNVGIFKKRVVRVFYFFTCCFIFDQIISNVAILLFANKGDPSPSQRYQSKSQPRLRLSGSLAVKASRTYLSTASKSAFPL